MTADRWTVDSAGDTARAFLRMTGLAEPQARLVRFFQNAIFHLPGAGLALRVYGPEDARKRATLMVSFATFLAERDFPSVRLSPLLPEQPVEVMGRQVSLWRWVEADTSGAKRPHDFGALLRALHDVADAAGFAAERFDPIAKIRGRLARLEDLDCLPTGHLGVLQTALRRAAESAADLDGSDVPAGLLHGDALLGNTILSGGKLILIDFDSVGYGARAWDLAPTYVTATRFRRRPDVWRAFLAGYGVDRAPLEGVEAAAVVKQLSMTVALCLTHGLSPAVDEEIDLRIRCWKDWDFETPWHSPALLPAL